MTWLSNVICYYVPHFVPLVKREKFTAIVNNERRQNIVISPLRNVTTIGKMSKKGRVCQVDRAVNV